MRHTGESRVSGRIDRIAHPIATILRMYIGKRTHERCGGRCENAESVGGRREQRQFHATSRSSPLAVEYESRYGCIMRTIGAHCDKRGEIIYFVR